MHPGATGKNMSRFEDKANSVVVPVTGIVTMMIYFQDEKES